MLTKKDNYEKSPEKCEKMAIFGPFHNVHTTITLVLTISYYFLNNLILHILGFYL